jgi:hypothetical protein
VNVKENIRKKQRKLQCFFVKLAEKSRSEKIGKLFLPLLYNPSAEGKNKISTIHRWHRGATGSAISEKKEP